MKILFLCVANSARSQMAEGLARSIYGANVTILSAGSAPSKVNPFAVQAMKNIGIDISTHYSKRIDEVLDEDIDLIVTLCADEVCPTVPGSIQKQHWPFEDPASAIGSENDILESFENIRDQIKTKLIDFGKKTNLLKEE